MEAFKNRLATQLVEGVFAVTDTKKVNYLNLAVDFLVLGSTFLLASLLLSVDAVGDLFLQTVLYAATLVACVCLTRWIAMRNNNVANSPTRKIFSNAAGIVIGTCVTLLFKDSFATGGDFIAAAIFSGATAFFVLGTLAPLIAYKSTST